MSLDWPATADPEAQDWDFTSYGPDGEPVGSGATLANPEVITDPRPAAGHLHPRGRQLRRRLGAVRLVRRGDLPSPNPPSPTGTKEAWLLSCADKRGNVLATREVVVDRGETIDVGNACKRVKG